MYSTFAISLLKAAILSSLLRPATAQTYSSCNPLTQGGCPADPALGKSLDIDFTSGASSEFTASGNPTYDSNGAAFTVAKSGDSPSISSKWYIMFGHVDYVIKAAPGTGIVSAAVLQSDCLDEIDWEWLGGDDTQAQSNYFGKGITTTGYNRGAFHAAADNHDTFHTYSVDWTADQIVWSIDGTTVRAMTQAQAESGEYPQTPMYVKLGAWAGGDPSNPAGTIQWAGGETDYSAGPFTMYVKSVHVTDYSTGSQYSYSGTSGTWQSIESSGGQINGEGNGTPVSSSEAPAATSHVSNSAPLAFSNSDTTSSDSATRTGWPWSGTATATAVTVTQSPSLSSAQAPSSASGSASLEVLTSYNDQGFPTLVTISPATTVTSQSFDSQGFPITSSTQSVVTISLPTTTTNTTADSGSSTAPVSPASTDEGQSGSSSSTIAPVGSTGTPGSNSSLATNPGGSPVTYTESPFATTNSGVASAGTAQPSVTSSYAFSSNTTRSSVSGGTQASTTSTSKDITRPTLSTTGTVTGSPTRSTTTTLATSNVSSSSTSAEISSKSTNTALPSGPSTTLRTSTGPSSAQTQSPSSPSTGTPPAVNEATAGHSFSGVGAILAFGVAFLFF